MKRYSAFAIAREATRYHQGWERAWASPIYLSYVTPATLDLTGGGSIPADDMIENDLPQEEAAPEEDE